jgi:hypothetical protein
MRSILCACLTLLLSAFAFNPLFAQGWQWSRHFGGPGHDYGQIGAVDAAGNVYCFGSYAGPGPGNYTDLYIGNDTLHGRNGSFVTKYDASGNLEWALNMVCVNPDYAIRAAALVLDTVNNSLVITGSHAASCLIGGVALPDSGSFLAKVDLNGNCLWAENIGSAKTATKSLLLNENNELFVCGVISQGETSSIGGQIIAPGAFIAKYVLDGTLLWAKALISGVTSSGLARFYPYTLKLHAGAIYIHGPCFTPPNQEPIVVDTINIGTANSVDVLMGVDEITGIAQWIRTFGEGYGATYGYENHMSVSNSGNVYCMGFAYFNDSISFGSDTVLVVPPNGISYLVEYSPDGEFMHLHTYTTVGLEAIDVTVDGSLLLIGEVNTEPSSLDVCDISMGQGLFVSRLDSMGNCINMITTGYATGASILQASQGIYLSATTPPDPQFNTNTFAGESVTSYGFEDVLLAKLDLSLGVQSLTVDGNDGLSIYANPNQGSFQIQVPDGLVNSPHLELRIYDATGRLVLAQPMGAEDHPQFDLYGIGSGFYAVTLSNGQRVYHGNMVVE